MYSNQELMTIFKNCHSVSELAKVVMALMYFLEDGDISEKQRKFIYQRVRIRKRQF